MDEMAKMTEQERREAGDAWVKHMREEEDRISRATEGWPELTAADAARNVGMPLEMMHVISWSITDGITPEEYIINVLRAERERRSAEEHKAADKRLLDTEIDAAAREGLPILEWVISRIGGKNAHTRVEDISPVFLRQLINRLEERLAGAESTSDGEVL